MKPELWLLWATKTMLRSDSINEAQCLSSRPVPKTAPYSKCEFRRCGRNHASTAARGHRHNRVPVGSRLRCVILTASPPPHRLNSLLGKGRVKAVTLVIDLCAGLKGISTHRASSFLEVCGGPRSDITNLTDQKIIFTGFPI